MKVVPVSIVDVVGATILGVAGVLLSLIPPVSTSAVPDAATVSNGSTMVMSAAVAALLDIWEVRELNICSVLGREKRRLELTLIKISLVDVRLVTLQNKVPLEVGRVLGRYSSPLLRLNIWVRVFSGMCVYEI